MPTPPSSDQQDQRGPDDERVDAEARASPEHTPASHLSSASRRTSRDRIQSKNRSSPGPGSGRSGRARRRPRGLRHSRPCCRPAGPAAMRVDPEPTLKAAPSHPECRRNPTVVRQDEDMPTPYERPAAPTRRRGPRAAPPRPALARPVEGKVIAGVVRGAGRAPRAGRCAWSGSPRPVSSPRRGRGGLRVPLGAHRPRRGGVRCAAVARSGRPTPADLAAARPWPGSPCPGAATLRSGRPRRVLLVGGRLLLVGLSSSPRTPASTPSSGILVPLLVVAVGAVIAWSQLDDSQRGRWLGAARDRRFSVARLAFGAVLALAGLIVWPRAAGRSAASGTSAPPCSPSSPGSVLIAAPWGLRLWSDLRHEQAERARATERADIAAHLHDSVLQTLALIQRKADDPAAVDPARPRPGARAARLAVRRPVRLRRHPRGRGGRGGPRGRGPPRHTGRRGRHRRPADGRRRPAPSSGPCARPLPTPSATVPAGLALRRGGARGGRGVRPRPRPGLRARRRARRTGWGARSRSSGRMDRHGGRPGCAGSSRAPRSS